MAARGRRYIESAWCYLLHEYSGVEEADTVSLQMS
jgi:hypothetical protein